MSSKKLQNNSFWSLLRFIAWAVVSTGQSIAQFFRAITGKKTSGTLEQNHFLNTLHYMLYDFPKKFWKKPTGIGMGRSIAECLLFLLSKEEKFERASPSKKGFTLVEMMVTITILSIILMAGFAAFWDIAKYRTLVGGRVDINEELYSAVESIVTTIKNGGGIDYEEYFNREVVGKTMSHWHYSVFSGFGNNGTEYVCRSTTAASMSGSGCYATPALNTANTSQAGLPQRYGAYKLQHTDYNADRTDDGAQCAVRGISGISAGDADCSGDIRSDSDDEDLGVWPPALGEATTPELYLARQGSSGLERFILRRRVTQDPDAPAGVTCDTTAGTGSGCIGQLEILRLIGRDLGTNHLGSWAGYSDGVIDTWECAADFTCTTVWALIGWTQRYLPSGSDSEWVSILSPNIDVRSITFAPSPLKNYAYNWRGSDTSINKNDSVRLSLTLGYGWKKRKSIGLRDPEVTISTTINLQP